MSSVMAIALAVRVVVKGIDHLVDVAMRGNVLWENGSV
jgi:hypothetical protein